MDFMDETIGGWSGEPSTKTSALLTATDRFLLTSIQAAQGLPEQASDTARNSNTIAFTTASPQDLTR
jgi:hypothetical protein